MPRDPVRCARWQGVVRTLVPFADTADGCHFSELERNLPLRRGSDWYGELLIVRIPGNSNQRDQGDASMAEANEHFALGLNKGGFILFIVLIFVCLPLCWLPWVINSCKAPQR